MRKLMKPIQLFITICAFIGSLCGVSAAQAEGSAKPWDAAAALKKDQVCTRCHDESETKPILSLYQTKHGVRADSNAPNCQSCHGESDKHLHGDPNVKGRASPDVIFGTKSGTSGDFAPKDASEQNAVCLRCHNKDSKRSHWDGSTHQRENVSCASCHTIHNGGHDNVRDKRTQPEVCFNCHKEQRALISKPSHHPITEGKMTCSDCHNPHGSVGPKLMKRDSVNETCYTCHMEKRGPFVHSHEPVDDDCSNCHNPHGATAENMLKMRAPFLCNTCHSPHGLVTPALGTLGAPSGMNSTTITQGRSCMNCHTQVHGSNNPSTSPANAQFLLR
jgi:DmsE family decaheme c-type cytochrome